MITKLDLINKVKDALLMPVVSATTAILTPENNSDCKHFTHLSAIINAIAVGTTGYTFFATTFLATDIWNYLTRKERAIVIFTFLLGLGASAYSLYFWNNHDEVQRAGISAATGAAFFNIGTNLATLFSSNKITNDREEKLVTGQAEEFVTPRTEPV